MPKLQSLFSPKSFAVVGVSSQPNKLGSVVFRNILNAGFSGPVFPVNPKYEKVFGVQCYESVAKIKESIDVVVIAVPAEFVLDVVDDCVKKKVKYMVIISAGFKEIGEKGAVMEAKIRNIAKQAGIGVLGPNCLGYSVSDSYVNATFAALQPKPGSIAFLSQSGAINSALLDLAEERKLGFSHFVSMGNKMDLNEMDFLEEWLQDPKVKVIGMYIEQFIDGKDFVDLIKRYPSKPIVILHPGETEASQKAMASHTGSLAGSSAIIRAALAQAGVVQVDSFEKLFNAMWLLSSSKMPKSNKVAVVTNAGGPGVMLTDMLVTAGLEVAKLDEATKNSLNEVLPEAASVENPIDLIGDALADRYEAALNILETDPNTDTILVVVTPQLVTQIEETAKFVIDHIKVSNKLILPLFMGGEYMESAIERFDLAEVPAFMYPEQAVNALAAITKYAEQSHKQGIKIKRVHTGKYQTEVAAATKQKLTALPQELTYKLAQEVGLDLPKQRIIKSFDEALGFVGESHFPVVLKALSEDIAHKTDLKALYLNIHNVNQLHSAFTKLSADIQAHTGKKSIGLLIQQQISGNEEILIGLNRDGGSDVYEQNGKGFGHLLVFGKGGIYTEVYQDIASGLLPLSRSELLGLVNKTKVAKIIGGFRGKQSLSMDKLLFTLDAVQTLAQKYPQIQSMDINPAMLTEKKCVVVDIKIFLQN